MDDDANNRASDFTYRVLREEGASTRFPILETILLTPNLHPKEIEDSAASLLGNSHPGTTFRGAIGNAIVAQDIRDHLLVGWVNQEPPIGLLAPWAAPAVGRTKPDLLACSMGGEVVVVDGKSLTVEAAVAPCIAERTGGLVGSVNFGPQFVYLIGEVTVSRRPKVVTPRARKVGEWARGLAAAALVPFVTIGALHLERGVMFDAPTRALQQEVRRLVLPPGGFIMVVRNLARTTAQIAHRISQRLQAGP